VFHASRKIFAAFALLSAGIFASAQNRIIYSATADAHADIAQAIHSAAREHKRVLLDFGGNWCGDCQVLNIYFHQPQNHAILDKNYVLVDIDIGRMDKNAASRHWLFSIRMAACSTARKTANLNRCAAWTRNRSRNS
jgi:thiol:disulfide interchange protein